MAKETGKKPGLSNISETWDENERKRSDSHAAESETPATGSEDLNRTIREEAAEYDQANKEDRILGGDRATRNDDESGS